MKERNKQGEDMFLFKKGDKVKLNNESKNLLNEKLFNALSDDVFTIVDIKTDHSCELNNLNCTCDKFITIKNGAISLHSLVSEELFLIEE